MGIRRQEIITPGQDRESTHDRSDSDGPRRVRAGEPRRAPAELDSGASATTALIHAHGKTAHLIPFTHWGNSGPPTGPAVVRRGPVRVRGPVRLRPWSGLSRRAVRKSPPARRRAMLPLPRRPGRDHPWATFMASEAVMPSASIQRASRGTGSRCRTACR
jgi:hypothetical protein